MTREEAINEIKSWSIPSKKGREVLETLIPELREDKDERTRERLIDFISDIKRISESGRNTWAVRKDDAEMCDAFLTYLEKVKDASKAIEAVDRIDKYIDEKVANAHDMKDSNPDKKYYRGWDDALGKMAGILQDVYSNEKQKEQPISAEEVLARAGLKPYKDGNKWCILAGDNIQEGICGFGDTIDEALYEFLKEVIDLQKEQKSIEDVVKDITKNKESAIKFLKSAGIMNDNGELAEIYRSEQKPISFNEPYNPNDYEVVMEGNATSLKRKEQKPVECITDAEMEKGLDELTKFKQFASALSDMYNIIPSHTSLRPKDIDWNNFCAGLLTYLKRNQPAEWSEEDKTIIEGACNALEIHGHTKLAERLKSLR